MRREITALLMALIFPTILLAQVPGPHTMIEKIIMVHGTYLPSVNPMPCGCKDLDEEESARVSEFFEKVAGWPNFRSIYPMGKWEKDISGCHVPVGAEECRSRLENAGVDFKPVHDRPGITHPVLLGSEINGVRLKSKGDLVVSCDLALSIVRMTEILSEMDAREVGIFSAHRPESSYSFHSLGLALDINFFVSSKWKVGVWVKTNFEKSEKYKTCNYKTETKKGAFLMDVICALWEERVFNTIITPNYNEAHLNHFHVDVRPGDNRFYIH